MVGEAGSGGGRVYIDDKLIRAQQSRVLRSEVSGAWEERAGERKLSKVIEGDVE